MNLNYLFFVFIINLYNLPVALSAKEKPKHQDVLVSGDCINFETTEKFCKEEAELKYGELSQTGKHHCCYLLVEIECLKEHSEKCVQYKILDRVIKGNLNAKIEYRESQCSSFTDCPEETYNIWLMIGAIFTAFIATSAFCIICYFFFKI